MAGLVVALAITFMLGAVGAAEAQEGAPPAPDAAASVEPAMDACVSDEERLIVLRASPDLTATVARAAEIVRLRTGAHVVLGDPPPLAVPDAVGRCEVGVAWTDGRSTVDVLDGVPRQPRLRLVFSGASGQHATELEVDEVPSARSLALAMLALMRPAIEPAPLRPAPSSGSYVYRAPEDGPLGPRRPIEPIARPTLYFRALVGISTARSTALIGPGVGVGLCVRDDCVVIEGDLPILSDERPGFGDDAIEYRPITLSMRAQLRPLRAGPVTAGLSFGPMTRLGNARVEATGATQVVTSLGGRATLELAWTFVPRFELVVEVGVDGALNPARFTRGGITVLLEDQATLWGVLSVRLRP